VGKLQEDLVDSLTGVKNSSSFGGRGNPHGKKSTRILIPQERGGGQKKGRRYGLKSRFKNWGDQEDLARRTRFTRKGKAAQIEKKKEEEKKYVEVKKHSGKRRARYLGAYRKIGVKKKKTGKDHEMAEKEKGSERGGK